MPAEGKITLDAKQYEAMLASVQKKTASATSQMGKDANAMGRNFSKVGAAIGQLSGAAPAAFGQIGSAIQTLVMGKLGVLIAMIGTIVSAAVDMWDRMTLSAEEYAHKVEMAAERANKAWNKQQKQHGEDRGYMDRLVELAKKERLSNEAKAEAAQLISVLTTRYGKLGVSIDGVTGAIKGADEAQKRLLERQRQQQMKLLEIKMNANRGKMRNQAKDAMKEHLGDDIVSNIITLGGVHVIAQNAYEHMEEYMRVKPIEEQIKGFSRLREKSKTTAQMDKWQKVIDALEAQLEMEQQMRDLRDWGSATESEAAAQARKNSEKAQRKTDFVEDQRKQVEYQVLLNAGKVEEAEMLKLINDLKRQGINLTKEEARAMVQGRQQLAGDAQYRKAKEQLEHQLYVQRLLLRGERERAREVENANQFTSRGNSVWSDQIDHIGRLQRQLESAELAKAQQDEYRSLYERALRATGRDREADEYSALERARAQKGGSELTTQERDATLRLVDLTRQLQEAANSPVSSLAIRANELTARGGGGGKSAAETAAERYNREMLTRSGTTNSILREIQKEVKRQRVSTYVADPSE